MNFFQYIGDFFNYIFEYIDHFFTTVGFFFEIVVNGLESAISLVFEPLFPPFLSGFIAFVVVISVVKLIFTLGGFHE